jgi:hypothetical protein
LKRVYPQINREAIKMSVEWGKKMDEEAAVNTIEARRGPNLLGQNSQWHTWFLSALPNH